MTPAEAVAAGQATVDNLETPYDGVFAAAHADDLNGRIDAFLAPGGGGDLFAALARAGTDLAADRVPDFGLHDELGLLLLAQDPTRSVAALHAITAVVLHGRLLTRRDLDAQLRQAAVLADAG